IERDANRGAQAPEAWRRGIEELPGRVERAGQGRADRRQWVQLAPELALEGPASVRQVRLQRRGRVEGRPDIEELLRVQAAAAGGALDGRTDVASAGDPNAGTLLVEGAGDDDGIRARAQRLGETAAGAERGPLGQPCADEREFEQLDRALVHGISAPRRPGCRGRRTARAGFATAP